VPEPREHRLARHEACDRTDDQPAQGDQVVADAAVDQQREDRPEDREQSLSVFIDTMLICACTAFVILLGDVYVPGNEAVDGVVLTQQSPASHVGDRVGYFLTIAIMLFAFSSVIYTYYLGEKAVSILTDHPASLHVLRIAIVGIVFPGAIAPGATAVFFFSGPMMGILAVVNLLASTMLFPIAKRLIDDFDGQLSAGIDRPLLDPDAYADLDIDRQAWTGRIKGDGAGVTVTAATDGPDRVPVFG